MKRPILIIAIGYIIGILGGLYLQISIVLFLIFIAIIILLKINENKMMRLKRYSRYIRLYINHKTILILTITAVIGSGVIYFNEKEYENVQDKLLKVENVMLIGKVEREEKSNEYGKIYKVKIQSIIQNGNEYKINKKSIYVYQKSSNKITMKYGDIIKVEGKFEEPAGRRNYKGFDYKLYLKTKGIIGNLKLTNIKMIENKIVIPIEYLECKSISLFDNLKGKANTLLPNEISSVFIGLMFGDTSGISDDVKEDFRNANMSHVLAVSGMHMSYLILFSTYVFGKILGKRQSYYMSIILIVLYMFLTGFSASIVRAGIMGIILICSKIFYKCNDILTSLSIAVLLILIRNPYIILDLSFQFSFGGTLGIVLFQNFISKNFLEKVINSKRIVDILSVTISAQLVILPISLVHFNIVNVYFILSNVIIGFIIGPIMIFCFIFLISIIINIKFAEIFSLILQIVLRILIFISKVSKLPYSSIYVATPNCIQIFFYFLFIISFFAVFYMYKTPKILPTVKRFRNIIAMLKFYIKYRFSDNKKIVSKILSVILMIFIIVIKIVPKDLSIHFIDVNQGDSTFIVTPNGKSILIDGGGNAYSNVGKNILLPYVLDRGYTKIDVVIISHTDLDHCDGIIYLMEKIKIKTVIMGKQYEESDNYKKIIVLAKNKKIVVKFVEAGNNINIEKNLCLEVLWPNSKNKILENSINNNSLVFKLKYKNFSMLFTGDIEELAEKKILQIYGKNLASTVLKIAHHGSKTSTNINFLNAVNPKYALIGVGKNNKFGHPSKETIKKLNDLNVKIYRTDEFGEITINVNKRVEISTY